MPTDDLDALVRELTSAGWSLESDQTRMPIPPAFGVSARTLHDPEQQLEIYLMDFAGGGLTLELATRTPYEAGPAWRIEAIDLPATVILAAAHASTEPDDARSLAGRLTNGHWVLEAEEYEGDHVAYQRWLGPDTVRRAVYLAPQRGPRSESGWSIYRRGLLGPHIHTGLDAPPAVIAAIALTN
ncbi:hypothetical protein [Actinospica robiniae]|uniref:hypothetical protein n=1 Tax=Actinospica robiniae TaxID=304901 RepID=UPI0003FEF6AC|nr:hypothetical protein [Actinospica robiniae]